MITQHGQCKKCPSGFYGPPTHKADGTSEHLVYRCTACGHVDHRPVQDAGEGNSFVGSHQPTRRRR